MKHNVNTSEYLGKHYYGTNPCIHPLAMAELMLRLERKRHTPKQPCNPLAKKLQTLATRYL